MGHSNPTARGFGRLVGALALVIRISGQLFHHVIALLETKRACLGRAACSNNSNFGNSMSPFSSDRATSVG